MLLHNLRQFFVFQSALPRGERREMHVEYWFGDPDFNPRSREGSDEKDNERFLQMVRFQSALPRGERLPNNDY